MKKIHLKPTQFSPEVLLSPEEKIFSIRGNSRPEDVRELYYPVVSWLIEYREALKSEGVKEFTKKDPMVMEFDLGYFNSSSTKFLYDIIKILQEMNDSGIPTEIRWVYEEEDIDMKEAGEDLSSLAEIDFKFFKK